MWYFERFDLCKSLVTYKDNYTETHRFDHLVKERERERDCVGMETIDTNVSNAVVVQFKMVSMR